tara:strand:+ start:368 stop:748 length:381 start_codon:yes stop_codon:yes gene_type:complete
MRLPGSFSLHVRNQPLSAFSNLSLIQPQNDVLSKLRIFVTKVLQQMEREGESMNTTDGEKIEGEKREGEMREGEERRQRERRQRERREERGREDAPPTGARQDHRPKGSRLNAAPFGGREKACMRL